MKMEKKKRGADPAANKGFAPDPELELPIGKSRLSSLLRVNLFLRELRSFGYVYHVFKVLR